MRLFERLVLIVGLATLAGLLYHFDPAAVWRQISAIGWGFALIIPFQICDHLLNALGWRFCFEAKDAARVPFRSLVFVRVAGDGVNYLTPSASVAGEFIRPAMLSGSLGAEARNASVAVAKFSQALAQGIFIFLGLLLVVRGHLDFLTPLQRAAGLGAAAMTMLLSALALFVLATPPGPGVRPWQAQGAFAPVRLLMRQYLRRHPARFALSLACFVLGYAWGALEVMLICHCMGLKIELWTALSVEILSNVIDSLMFMVPGKVGTQEGGKVLIFKGLGYAPADGLAFGLIRHLRELFWAGAGFALYAWHRRRALAREAAVTPGLSPPGPAPLGRAGSSGPAVR